jgi:hypothetical protein
MALPNYSISLTPTQKTAVTAALNTVASTYGPLLPVWKQLTPAQKTAVLAHSSQLARIYAWAQMIVGN